VRRVSLVAFLLAALAFPSGALAGSGLSPVDPASPNAEKIADIYWLILGLSTIVFLAVFVPLGYFLVRFRSRGRPREVEGPQIRGHTRLELGWTIGPVLILAVIAAFVFVKLPGIRNVASAEDVMTVRVEGRQFYWNYVYENGVVSVDTLTLPAGRPVMLEITAPKGDVIHSFWVPALQGKFDAIPGEVVSTTIRADRPGVYAGQCAEFCGIEHASMRLAVRVLPATEFDEWIASGERDDELGDVTYRGACAKCHGLAGKGGIGPKLDQNPIVQEEETLRDVVANGRGKMPSVGDGWSDDQLDALVAYVSKRFAVKEADGDES